MSWLNEYGAIATAARTQDIDLARGKTLKLAATVPFLSSMMRHYQEDAPYITTVRESITHKI
jgi:hypothetical protein